MVKSRSLHLKWNGLLVFGLLQSALAFFPPVYELPEVGALYPEEPIDQYESGLDQQVEEENAQNDGALFLPLALPIGQTAGLAMDPANNLVLFHRSGRVWDESSFDSKNKFNLGPISNATIAILDSETGKQIAEHGKDMFYMPHGLTIDSQGNYWLTDIGAHQIFKMDKNFKPLMSLGKKLIPGSDDEHFCKPTDVAVASTGEFFVADGYCNSRIMKFGKDGQLLAKFGTQNTANPPRNGEFFVPHSLTLIEDLNLLCVADRENERIQCFSAGLLDSQTHHRRAYIPTGKFFTKAEGIGRIFAIRERKHYLFGVTNRGREQAEPQIFIMDINSGRVNTFAEGLDNVHAIAIADNGDVFVSQMEPSQIIKFKLPIDGEKRADE